MRAVALLAACSLLVFWPLEAEELEVEHVKMVSAPRVFHPGDKPGYWEDFGLTEAFDFSTATNTLAAVIKKVNGPARLFVFDLEQGTIRFQATISQAEVRAIKPSPDGKIAAVAGEDKEVSLWNVEGGVPIDKKVTDGRASDVDWHPSGKLLAVVAGKRIEIWKVTEAALELQQTIRGAWLTAPTEWPMSARWSPDGEYLAIGG
jgi:WD40 repeat protein